jgi:hypothetical protein
MTVPNTNDPAWQVQKAIVTRLKADNRLVELLGGTGKVYDFKPENTGYPCIVYGESDEASPWDTSSELGEELRIQIGVWSEAQGRKIIRDVQRRVHFLIYNQEAALSIGMAGHRVVHIERIVSAVVREPDGQYYHGVMQFNIKTEELEN